MIYTDRTTKESMELHVVLVKMVAKNLHPQIDQNLRELL